MMMTNAVSLLERVEHVIVTAAQDVATLFGPPVTRAELQALMVDGEFGTGMPKPINFPDSL